MAPVFLLAAAAVASPPTCSGADECAKRWGRAIRWVLDHNAVLDVQNGDLIRTAPADPAGTNFYQVTRIPNGSDSYSFDLRIGCGNPFLRCDWKKQKADFSETVSAP